jgi:glycosyltransferase involved in cell wall biosynthesis
VRILVLTNLYPTPFHMHRAPFIRHRLRIMSQINPVRVIAPVAWTDEVTAYWKGQPRIPKSRMRTQDGITVEHPRFYFTPRLLRRYYGQFFLASVRRAFRRALTEFRPELIYAPWAYPDGWAAVRLAKRARLPVVVRVLGSDVLLLEKFGARRPGTVEALRGADGVVAVSKDLEKHVIEFGVPAERVRAIYDGVEYNIFHPGPKAESRRRVQLADGEPALLFIGNLVPVKAVDVLLEACALLAKGGRGFRLNIIGQGPLRGRLEQLAARLGIAGRVMFLGSRPQPELADWYRASDLFVLPSHSEGVPNVLLEASACDTPWVATSVGGIPEIVHLGRGRLVPPANPTALAEAIGRALREPPPDRAGPGPRSRKESVVELSAFLHNIRSKYAVNRSRSCW